MKLPDHRSRLFYHLVPSVLAIFLSACVATPNTAKRNQVNVYHFTAQTKHPINIRVIDKRPLEETVPDPKFSTGYAYTTFGAEAQARNFAMEIGEHLTRGKASPEYRNLNAHDGQNSSGLLLTFTMNHWYAKWPLRIEKGRSLVLVEGLFDVALDISDGGTVLYKNTYRTEGNKQWAALDGVNKDNYAEYIHRNLGQKGNEVLTGVLGLVIPDLEANWPKLVAAEKSN